MEFTLEKVKDLFNKGQFSSICKTVGSDLSSLKLLPPDARVLIAHANFYAGRVQVASALAESVIHGKASPAATAHAFIVSGLLHKRDGHVDKAATDLRNALRVAREERDTTQLAWAHAHLFRLIAVAGYPESHLTALLTDARRSVSTAGDAHAMAYLHDSVATMEAQRGHTVEAERHVRLARSLLKLRPSSWLSEVVAVNAACVAFINRDTEGFCHYLDDARASARLSGSVTTSAAIDTNEAYVAVVTGRFARALSLIERLLESPLSIHHELAARESLARMYLSMGLLDSCDTQLARIKEHRSSDEARSFPFRGAAVMEVRLLIRKKEYGAAAKLAQEHVRDLQKLNDKSALIALVTLRALALGLSGESADCSRYLLEASDLGATSMKELQADYAHACGLILKHLNRENALRFESRSFRIWGAHGNVCGPLEAITANGHAADDDAAAKRLIQQHKPRLSRLNPESLESRETVINHLASAFDVAYRPELIGDELTQAIQLCQLSSRIETSKTSTGVGERAPALVLGNVGDKPITLICEPPDDPFKAILLGDILRIGRAALALERAREEERSRAALWPADPVEDQGDAIFLAEEMQALLATARRIADDQRAGAHHRRDRHRQGSPRPHDSRLLDPRHRDLPALQLRLDAEGHARLAAVRPSPRRLHRRRRALPGRHPRRRRRHAVPRRDRRHRPRRPAQAAALPRGQRSPPDRRDAAGARRRPRHRRHQRRPRRPGPRRTLPRRSLLPPQHRPPAPAAAARAPRRDPDAGQSLPPQARAGIPQGRSAARPRRRWST